MVQKSSNLTMEQLLAAHSKKAVSLHRGQEVEGTVVLIGDRELILDLGAKAEGVISKKDIPTEKLESLKTGDKLKGFVTQTESESGQVILSSYPYTPPARSGSRGSRKPDFSRFLQAQNQKSKLKGQLIEVNKGGLIVEVDRIRGFLPNSQVGFELLQKSAAAGDDMNSLTGEELTVTVIEVDSDNNRLIFSQRGEVSEEVKDKLKDFKKGQKVVGKVVAVLPFGLVVATEGVEGLVFISEVSWDKVDDLSKLFTPGQEVEANVLEPDLELGRLNLSIKQLQEDPFSKLAEKYQTDDVVGAEVTAVDGNGVSFKLKDDTPAFLPASKIDSASNYEIGTTVNMLVDSVDPRKRVVNLVPFVTSTSDLIYK